MPIAVNSHLHQDVEHLVVAPEKRAGSRLPGLRVPRSGYFASAQQRKPTAGDR